MLASIVGSPVSTSPALPFTFTPEDLATSPVIDITPSSSKYTDAGSTAVSADGDLVYQLTDDAGVVWTQATEANRPIHRTNVYGSTAGIEFGSEAAQRWMNAALSEGSASNRTIYFVGEVLSPGYLFDDASPRTVVGGISATSLYAANGAFVGSVGHTKAMYPHVRAYVLDSAGNSKYFENGVLKESGLAFTQVGWSNPRLGAHYTSPGTSTGGFRLIAWKDYRDVHADQEVQDMSTWLANTYLPALSDQTELKIVSWAGGSTKTVNDSEYPYNRPSNDEDEQGGTIVTSIVAGGPDTNFLRCTVTDGYNFYAQANAEWYGDSKCFLRNVADERHKWTFDNFNRLTLWYRPPADFDAPRTDGTYTTEIGTYVKSVETPNWSSDEVPNGHHFYHRFNPLPGVWNKIVMHWHPDHERGASGNTEHGEQQYPISGESNRNYFDAFTRWYITMNTKDLAKTYTGVHDLADVKVIREDNAEDIANLYNFTAAYRSSDNTIHLAFRTDKDNTGTFEVKYAFSNIHTLGYANATTAPSASALTRDGVTGYNGILYQTTSIDVSGEDTIWLAIQYSGNTSGFAQIELPLGYGS